MHHVVARHDVCLSDGGCNAHVGCSECDGAVCDSHHQRLARERLQGKTIREIASLVGAGDDVQAQDLHQTYIFSLLGTYLGDCCTDQGLQVVTDIGIVLYRHAACM